jgi:hypothetical protein
MSDIEQTLPTAVTETGFQKFWRPAAAATYLVICLVDFVAMPALVQIGHREVDPVSAVEVSLKFQDPATQIRVFDALTSKAAGTWEPITLKDSGFIHLAFGAILGAAAFTRGQEKVERVRNGVA